jgi:hypothetical protein
MEAVLVALLLMGGISYGIGLFFYNLFTGEYDRRREEIRLREAQEVAQEKERVERAEQEEAELVPEEAPRRRVGHRRRSKPTLRVIQGQRDDPPELDLASLDGIGDNPHEDI